MTSITIAADIRSQLGPVRDQGHRNTCLAFSASSAHEQSHRLTSQLCVEWIFYHAVKGLAAKAADGLTIDEACAAVERDGQPDEQHWPYQKTLDLSSWKLPPAPPTKVWRATASPVAIADIPGRLDAKIAIVIALSVGSGFAAGIGSIVQNELVLDVDPEPISQGEGHALVVAGHGSVGASPYLLVRNSWGPKWGRGGYGWIGISEVQDRWIGGFELGAKP